MDNDTPEWFAALDEVRQCENSDAVLEIFSRLDSMPEDTRWRVVSSGIDKLLDFNYEKILDLLIDLSLSEGEYSAHFVRQRLASCLKQEGVSKRSIVTSRLIIEIRNDDIERAANAIWTAIVVGYRDENLEGEFLRILETSSSSPLGDTALWGLVYLGFPEFLPIIRYIRKRLNGETPVSQPILSTLRKLASPEFLPELIFLLNQKEPKAELEMQTPDLVDVLYCFASIAKAHTHLSSTVWDIIGNLTSIGARDMGFYLGVTDVIDDERVCDYFLRPLVAREQTSVEDNNPTMINYHRYLGILRLALPKQIKGLQNWYGRATPVQRTTIWSAIHFDATAITHNLGPWQTESSLVKGHAWDALLRMNLHETDQWIVEALDESGPFALADTCHLAGYLKVDSAVPKLLRIVEQDGWDVEPGRKIVLGIAALEALGNIGTEEALSALLKSRVSLEGRLPGKSLLDTTLKKYTDAIVSAVQVIGDSGAIVRCLEQGLNVDNPRATVACVVALSDIARIASITLLKYHNRIVDLLQSDDWKTTPYLKFLVSAVGFFDCSKELEITVSRIALEDDIDLVVECAEALARWNALQRHPEVLKRIGLERRTDNSISAYRTLNYHEIFVLGLLHDSEPQQTVQMLTSIIRDGKYQDCAQLLNFLTVEGIDAEIISALIYRANRVNQTYISESEVLWTLTRIAPKKFVEVFQSSSVSEWQRGGRETVVACYQDIAESTDIEELKDNIADNLKGFLCDPAYSIRRRASRTLSEFRPIALQEAILEFSSSESMQHKLYGIEALTWVVDEGYYHDCISSALTDREIDIRKTALVTSDDRRRVRLSTSYLPNVLGSSGDDLLTIWPYAQALQLVGDDEVIRRLHKGAFDESCSPNKRTFLIKVKEDVEKGWKKFLEQREKDISE